MLAVLDDDRFADKAPEQVWAVLLDDGRYLCSVSTMYRILRAHNQIRERRAQASHPLRVIPELVATGPDQVFSWDITKLKGPTKGCYYDAYVIMDIYSRKIIHCEVHDGESGPLARDFLTNAIRANAGAVPRYVHSDNGTSMTSKTVAGEREKPTLALTVMLPSSSWRILRSSGRGCPSAALFHVSRSR